MDQPITDPTQGLVFTFDFDFDPDPDPDPDPELDNKIFFIQVEKTTAAICQRTLLIILPLTFASFVCGTIAEYEQVRIRISETLINLISITFQNPALYGGFTILNGVLGGMMMFFHITSNEKTRELLHKIFPCTKSKSDREE